VGKNYTGKSGNALNSRQITTWNSLIIPFAFRKCTKTTGFTRNTSNIAKEISSNYPYSRFSLHSPIYSFTEK